MRDLGRVLQGPVPAHSAQSVWVRGEAALCFERGRCQHFTADLDQDLEKCHYTVKRITFVSQIHDTQIS